jgi:hypothetical protein
VHLSDRKSLRESKIMTEPLIGCSEQEDNSQVRVTKSPDDFVKFPMLLRKPRFGRIVWLACVSISMDGVQFYFSEPASESFCPGLHLPHSRQ